MAHKLDPAKSKILVDEHVKIMDIDDIDSLSIDEMQAKLMEVKTVKKLNGNEMLCFNSMYTYLYVVTQRQETDKEFENRISKLKLAAESLAKSNLRKEMLEREEYTRLKRKYATELGD